MKVMKGLESKTYEKWLSSWFVQPKEVETGGKCHGGLQLPHDGEQRGRCLSLW